VVITIEVFKYRCDTTCNSAKAASAGSGYMELDRRGAEMLFQVLTERAEKTAIAIASNDSFSKAHTFGRGCARRRLTGSGSAAPAAAQHGG